MLCSQSVLARVCQTSKKHRDARGNTLIRGHSLRSQNSESNRSVPEKSIHSRGCRHRRKRDLVCSRRVFCKSSKVAVLNKTHVRHHTRVIRHCKAQRPDVADAVRVVVVHFDFELFICIKGIRWSGHYSWLRRKCWPSPEHCNVLVVTKRRVPPTRCL
jgi:hypothetical protein